MRCSCSKYAVLGYAVVIWRLLRKVLVTAPQFYLAMKPACGPCGQVQVRTVKGFRVKGLGFRAKGNIA